MIGRSLAPLALGALALLASPAAAQTSPANALQEWGLVGSWSVRCDLPASSGNSYYIFVVDPDGRAYQERDFGNPDQNDRSEILSVEPRADGTLALTIDFTSFGQVRVNVYTKSEGRTRVVHNSRADNSDVTVENGVLRHNGQPTPWFSKCG
jgi:hypothetical protein